LNLKPLRALDKNFDVDIAAWWDIVILFILLKSHSFGTLSKLQFLQLTQHCH
jgi:hypothetical protein